MVARYAGYAVLAALAWWAWNGPVADWRTVTPEEQLQANAQQIARCVHGKEFAAGAGGAFEADPEAACARKYRLYRHLGRWYSLDQPRPQGAGGHS